MSAFNVSSVSSSSVDFSGSNILKTNKKVAKGNFSSCLSDVMNKKDTEKKTDEKDTKVEKKNTIENICNWLCYGSSQYEEPDDKALIDALYNDDYRQYQDETKPHIGGYFVVHQSYPDGSEFYYPPKNASYDEKKTYVDQMKKLTRQERWEASGVVLDKFGGSPFHSFLNKVSMSDADNISTKKLFAELKDEVENNLAGMDSSDGNYKRRNEEAKIMDKLLDSVLDNKQADTDKVEK